VRPFASGRKPDHGMKPDPAAFGVLFAAAFWLAIAGLLQALWSNPGSGETAAGSGLALWMLLK
jgi:hypothetical protein